MAPAKLVNLKEVPGLDAIVEDDDGGLRIGPMVTLASLADHPLVRERYAVLADALRGSASPQIRNVATLGRQSAAAAALLVLPLAAYRCLRKGGGHCFAISGENQYHAIFDNALCAIVHPSTAATALVALDAQVELTDAAGARRTVSLEDFFVLPDRDLQRENDLRPQEILTAIRLPKPPASLRMAHVRQGEKDSFDWPLADVAVVLDVDADGVCRRAAVILGAAAPVPHRAKAAEVVLTGKRIDANVAAAAGARRPRRRHTALQERLTNCRCSRRSSAVRSSRLWPDNDRPPRIVRITNCDLARQIGAGHANAA